MRNCKSYSPLQLVKKVGALVHTHKPPPVILKLCAFLLMLSILVRTCSFLQLGKKRPAWSFEQTFAMREEEREGEEGRQQALQEAV